MEDNSKIELRNLYEGDVICGHEKDGSICSFFVVARLRRNNNTLWVYRIDSNSWESLMTGDSVIFWGMSYVGNIEGPALDE